MFAGLLEKEDDLFYLSIVNFEIVNVCWFTGKRRRNQTTWITLRSNNILILGELFVLIFVFADKTKMLLKNPPLIDKKTSFSSTLNFLAIQR